MKKPTLPTTILLLFLSFTSGAQKGNPALQKGNSVIGVGYGFISPYKSLFNQYSFLNGSGTTTKYIASGPFGLTYEYNLPHRISVGIQCAYGRIKNLTTKKDGLGSGKDYIITEKLDQFTAIARANYHFGRVARFDPYIGLGGGYGYFNYGKTSNNPSDTPADLALFSINIPAAFGFTGQLGARYYFNETLGVYAEAGYLAGSFFQTGLVFNVKGNSGAAK